MSDEPEIVVLDEEPEVTAPPPEPPKPKQKAKPLPKLVKDFTTAYGEEFFAHFGGKAPHYRLATTFHIHDISAEDADKCRKFPSWTKPKRLGLTVEWAEKMYKLKKLDRLEQPHGIE